MTDCDFLIIGAGIAGASAAYELAPHGKVVLLEAEAAPGYHSTGRSAAQFLETYGNAVVRGLTRASRPFYEAPPPGFAEHALLSPRPALYIAREDQLDKLAELEADVRRLTPEIARLSAEEARARVPVLRDGYVAAGLMEPAAMDIDVHALHQGYLKGLRQRGGMMVVNAEVQALSRAARAWQVETKAGRYSAPVVVNAAGAWSEQLGALAGAAAIGLQPKRRTVITFDGPDALDCRSWPVVADIGEQFYFKPDAGRILASPADETPVPPCDVQPEELDVAITVDRLETATTLQVRRIAHNWAGLRSFVADKSLVIGFDEGLEGFFWLAGQGGYGIQTAPAAAQVAAALITDGKLPDDVAAFGVKTEDLAPARLPHRAVAAASQRDP